MCGHHEGHQCNCASGGQCCGGHHTHNEEKLTAGERHFLTHLVENKYYPLSRFLLHSAQEPEFESVALAPVFLESAQQALEDVKLVGNTLKKLEDMGLITLDYDIPLEGYPYAEYHNAEIFAYFKETVQQAQSQPNFLGDTAVLELGSMAPTEACIAQFGAK